jgi:hypothetical protein
MRKKMVVSAKMIPFAEPALVLSYIMINLESGNIFHAPQPQCYALIKSDKKNLRLRAELTGYIGENHLIPLHH